jgi:hypothetical protein
MIAPFRVPLEPDEATGIGQARRFVARTLLSRHLVPHAPLPSIPAWKAWTFVSWIALVGVAYALHLMGWSF